MKVFIFVIFQIFKWLQSFIDPSTQKQQKSGFMIYYVDTHHMVTVTTLIPARNLSLVHSGSEPSENELSLYVDYKGWLVSKSFKSLEHLFPACPITMKNCIFVR